MNFTKLQTLKLKKHPKLNEKWLQDVIYNFPEILGIGDVFVRDRERVQPCAGRLDLLLEDNNGNGRYEVEVQLGATDPSHMIRTMEYWDIERKRHPQYDHTAILIAEDITSRFLNVISLLNGAIPIMALQVSAIETPEGVGLLFTKVLDTTAYYGVASEDENIGDSANRQYWENEKANPETTAIADDVLRIAQTINPDITMNYTRRYISFNLNGYSKIFGTCTPLRNNMTLSIRLPQTSEVDQLLANSNLDLLEYDKRKGYRLKVTKESLEANRPMITDLLRDAFEFKS
ncbi:hypothetical protein [Endozoicomonas sp. ALB032]|uniref:hypothetical protein n=1 Tax=Endozoicomonas sp. ALB032 TaxID=3403082 RepID=UPI003BB69123